MSAARTWIGIAVATAWLDVASTSEEPPWRVANDEAGIAALVSALAAREPALVGLEATGGHERAATAALAAAGIPVAVVNPRQVRDFAKATGQLAKSDALDAHRLALFAQRIQPPARPLPAETAQDLAALLARRPRSGAGPDLARQPPLAREGGAAAFHPRHRPGGGAHAAGRVAPARRVRPLGGGGPRRGGRRSPPTAGRAAASAAPGAAGERCAPRGTWPPSRPAGTTPSSAPTTGGCATRANPSKSPWSPACASC